MWMHGQGLFIFLVSLGALGVKLSLNLVCAFEPLLTYVLQGSFRICFLPSQGSYHSCSWHCSGMTWRKYFCFVVLPRRALRLHVSKAAEVCIGLPLQQQHSCHHLSPGLQGWNLLPDSHLWRGSMETHILQPVFTEPCQVSLHCTHIRENIWN